MLRYIAKRLLIAIPVIIGITLIEFMLINLAGSPLAMMQGPRVSQEAIDNRAAQLGLDQPVPIQYLNWMRELLQGNLGYSFTARQPVAALIGKHLGPTLLLMGVSLLIGLLISIPIGIFSATRRYTAGDYAVVSTSFLASSIPGFFFSMLLVYLFTVRLKWLPSGGMMTMGGNGGFWDIARHMVMPVLVLATSIAGSNVRYVRSSLIEILQKEYLRTAKAKGVSPFSLINKHAMRNALIPIVTMLGMQIPMLFGGAVIIEQFFSWPGLGLLTMSAIMSRDYPTIMGVSLFSALIVLGSNLVTDILYAVVNPTIRLTGAKE